MRLRLAALAAAGIFVLAAGIGAYADREVRAATRRAAAGELALLAAGVAGRTVVAADGTLRPPDLGDLPPTTSVRVTGAGGAIIEERGHAAAVAVGAVAPGGPAQAVDGQLAVASARQGGPTVVVARPLSEVDAPADRVRARLLAAAAIAAALAFVLGAVVGRSGAAAVARVISTAETIRRTGRPSARVHAPRPAAGTLAGRLARSFNGMLDEVEKAALRDRRLVADTSHELRTPLTALRADLELIDTADPGLSPAGRARALDEATRAAARMATLVDGLLVLARSDARADAAAARGDLAGDEADRSGRRPVDLAAVAAEAATEALAARGVAGAGSRATHGLELDLADDGPLVVGDEDALRRAVSNLVANALRYGDTTVRTRREGELAIVEVADDGPGVAPELAGRLFERFARHGTGSGSGLGLAIVAAVARDHGGDVRLVEAAPRSGAVFRLALPAYM